MSFIVQFILHKYLDRFFYGIDKKNIEAGILDGRITISNIGLQQNIFDTLNFPIKINYSYVEKVELHIPWRSEETPVNIYISNIYALISAKDRNTNIGDIFLKKKEKALREGIEAFLESLKQEPKNQKQAGMIENKIKKLLYNVNLNIGCVHLRYQEEKGSSRSGNSGEGLSFGLKINNINLYNVNKQGKKEFFNYQKSKEKIIRANLSIDFIGLYVNSKQTKFIFKKHPSTSLTTTARSVSKPSSKNPFTPSATKKTKQASKRDYAYITNQMRHISFPEKLSSSSTIHQQLHYIFVISVKTLVSYNLVAKELSKQTVDQEGYIGGGLDMTGVVSCDIDFPSVAFKITQEQFSDIKKIWEFFTSFQAYWRDYVSQRNIVIYKEKNCVDMSILLKQRRKKTELTSKQKFQLKGQCRKYLKWVFLTVYEERLKRSFLVEALKKDITLENLLKNDKIGRIIKKINEEKLKSWVMQAMAYRNKFVQATNIFERYSQTRIKQFLNKLLGTFQLMFTKKEQLSLKTQSRKEELIGQKPYEYEFSMKINLLTFEISKFEKFGVGFLMKNLRSEFLKRKENYSFEMRIQDLQANVFSNKNGQKRKTIVPIIRKSIIQSKQVDLLYLKYEKSPVGSLYVNAEYQLDFESIEITIYPQAFKQFYQILFSQPQKKKEPEIHKKKKTTQKKTQNPTQPQYNWNNEFQSPNLLLRNKVKGKIRSPWIILPLGRNNNPQKECWVVRLGDFSLQTPQIEGEGYKQNLYQQYTLELRQFELKFFSSVKFFYNWLKFNQNEQTLFSIPYYKDMKIVNMIKPFTCTVDFSTLKTGLSSATKSKNYSYISNIHIEGIQIFLSNFLLQKLKERLDIIGEEENYEDFQFIEQNVENIYEEHLISGWAKVSNEKWKQMRFFVVLKGHFLYYFVSESESKYYFFTDVRKTMVRLVGKVIEKINPEIKDQKVVIYLQDPNMLAEWKKHITFSLQKKEKKQEDKKEEEKKIAGRKEQQKDLISKQERAQKPQPNPAQRRKSLQSHPSTSSIGKQLPSQHTTSSSNTKMSITFMMNRLQIKLKDKQDKEFLLCYFKKSNFTYKCLYSPGAEFSLSSWDVFESYEHKERKVPFLSSKRFYHSDQGGGQVGGNEGGVGKMSDEGGREGRMREERERSEERGETMFRDENNNSRERNNNFLEVKVDFNSITNELSDINVDIDKFFIAWKVDLITKILTFFFYSAEMGQAPTPYTVEKRTLGIKFSMKRFYLYAYQGAQLVGLIKVSDASIIYYQSSIEEYFDVSLTRLEIDQSINNSLIHLENMLISKGPENPFKLRYHIRKKNYKKHKEFQVVENLKAEFGAETIVTLLSCELQDAIVVYEHELTFRMLNYVLNHVFGTIAAKFKKRSYSPKYIFEVLKLEKISTMDIRIRNFTFIVPPHNKNENHLMADIDEFKITKNINPTIPELRPSKVRVPTKFQPVNVFFQTMYFEFMNVKLYQRFGKQAPVPINKQPIDFRLSMSKINLSTDYYNVLNHYDDLDRLSVMKIQFLDELQVEVPKITFVTLLQIFYQNIKQRDGKAELFEPVTPYPAKKKYVIEFPAIKANLYEFDDKTKTMEVFDSMRMERFVIVYTVDDTKSEMRFSSTLVSSEGEMPIDVWSSRKERLFAFKMMGDSTNSITKIELNIKGYQLDFSFDRLNNLLEFINYDSDHVANKKMPSKASSFMCVNVFASDCLVKLEELWATGEFFVTYTKSAKNHYDSEILKYLEVEELERHSHQGTIEQRKSSEVRRESVFDPTKEQIADKEIKVDGENIKLSIRGDTIGEISSLYFHRLDLSAKKSMKRYKKQIVQIGQSILSVQLSDMSRILTAYDRRIKKSPEFVLKNFFQPWNTLPHKSSYTEKRRTEVEFSKISAFLIPNEKKNPLFYFMVDVKIPQLVYSTFHKDQEISVDLGATISQHTQCLFPEVVGEVKKVKVVYRSNKEKGNKDVQIGSANQVNCYLSNLNTQTLYILSQQISTLTSPSSPSLTTSTTPTLRKYLTYNYTKQQPIHSCITINNTTSHEITIQISSLPYINVPNFTLHKEKLTFQQLLEIFMDENAFIVIDVGNKKNVYKQRLKEVIVGREVELASEEMVVVFAVEGDTLVVRFCEGCVVRNLMKVAIHVYSAEDKQFVLNSGEEKCFQLVDTLSRRHSSSHLNIHKKIDKVRISLLLNPTSTNSTEHLKDKGEQISLKHSGEEQIFNGLILVKKIKKNGTLTIQLKERFVLSNFTPFVVGLGAGHSIKYKEQFPLSHGLYAQKDAVYSSQKYSISMNNRKIELNLRKCPQFFLIQLSPSAQSSQKSIKPTKMSVYANKTSIKIYLQSLQSQPTETTHIFLYTKTIYQSLTAQRILLYGRTHNNNGPMNETKDNGFQIDHEEEISLGDEVAFLGLESVLTEKGEVFSVRELVEGGKEGKDVGERCVFGDVYYLIQERVAIVGVAGVAFKESAVNSLKDQMTQTRIKICDCWSVANITPFLIKIKGGVDSLNTEQTSNKMQMRLQNQQYQQGYSSIMDIELHPNQQKSIPPSFLLSSRNPTTLAPFLSVCFMDLKHQIKFYRNLKISQQNISYIEVGQEICKVTVIVDREGKEQKETGSKSEGENGRLGAGRTRWLRVIVESSDQGYKVENLLGDVVVEVKNGELSRKEKEAHQNMRRSRKHSKEISYISDDYSIEEQMNTESSTNQILVQPSTSRQIGIKSFSSQGLKMLTLSFYYPLRNIDFKQSVVLQLDNLSALGKKELFLTDTSKKSSFTVLVLTEMLKENKFHIKLYKKSVYEESIPQMLKFTLKGFRLSLYLGQFKNTPQFQEQKIKLEFCNLQISREKHIDMQNFDVKLEKILLIQGNTLPIIAALDKDKQFLNLQAILEKAPHGLKGKNISVKLTPLEINGRQGIILRLLEKIAKIRSYKIKGSKLHSLMPRKQGLRVSMQRQRIVNLQFTIPEPNIQKEWELLKKGSKPISLELLEVAATSIFLSYTKSQQMLSNSPFLSDPILKYFLLLPSIGQTRLPIPNFEIKNFNGATKELLKLIAKELKSTIGQSILYSLTSLSIFDNPIQAVDDLVRYLMTILQTM